MYQIRTKQLPTRFCAASKGYSKVKTRNSAHMAATCDSQDSFHMRLEPHLTTHSLTQNHAMFSTQLQNKATDLKVYCCPVFCENQTKVIHAYYTNHGAEERKAVTELWDISQIC
ncbi:uncharacterized protein LOC143268146 isoform X2 [Peromyscus maniculatus bairdii]|uniref:uncharacterized protein LOC143268146 isoform X2 n=1 Tax=Peromyscus maniculatus bairdii TaxID=230844 RepID=UPI003FD6583D